MEVRTRRVRNVHVSAVLCPGAVALERRARELVRPGGQVHACSPRCLIILKHAVDARDARARAANRPARSNSGVVHGGVGYERSPVEMQRGTREQGQGGSRMRQMRSTVDEDEVTSSSTVSTTVRTCTPQMMFRRSSR